MTINQLDILTKSKSIKYWDSLLTSFVSNDFSDKDISIEDLLLKLPNAIKISARIKSCPKNDLITTRSTKIHLLHLYIADSTFDPNEYYKFLEQVLASYASVKLTFKYTSSSVVAIPDMEEIKKLRNFFNTKWKPENEKPRLTFYYENMPFMLF